MYVFYYLYENTDITINCISVSLSSIRAVFYFFSKMALEFICAKALEQGKKIILPRSANIYKIDFLNKKVSFYYSNPGGVYLGLNTWKVPLNAREMDFDIRSDKIGGYIIFSRFYNLKGNLLKIRNR